MRSKSGESAAGKLERIISTLTSQREELSDLANESDYHKASELTRAMDTLEATVKRLGEI